MLDQQDQPASRGFYIKFSPSDPRDVQLSHWIREDTQTRSVNVSAVIKALLYSWYKMRQLSGRLPMLSVGDQIPAGYPALPATARHESGEDPTDPLVQRLAGISFDHWG
jgi:hypothetical protein